MTCAEIEDLIADGSGWELAEAHARGCEACAEYLEAALTLDLALRAIRKTPARLSPAVMAAILPKPSYVPEILDFIGWAAMITVAVGLFERLLATY